jgi:hypothetical protein
MANEKKRPAGAEPPPVDQTNIEKVQCPNCCRLAFVTSRGMGLLFYKCELCETVGATPDPSHSG